MDHVLYESLLNEVASKAEGKLQELLIAISPLYKEDSSLPYNIQYPLINLYTNLFKTTESIVFLVSHGCLWDAKYLSRTVAEGALKFIYIFRGSNEDIQYTLNEYLNIIPSINRIKLHDTAKKFLNTNIIEPLKRQALEDTLLCEEEINIFKNKYPNKVKEKIKSKWSNNGILKALENHLDINLYISLIFDYKLNSEIAHMDADILEQKRNFMDDMSRGNYSEPISLGIMTLINTLTLLLICTLRFLHLQGVDPIIFDNELLEYHKFVLELYKIDVDIE